MSFPNLDRAQALRQLELLGYQSGDNVYLRFFYPSNDPRKDEDKGRKADRLNWKEIEAYQRQGRGVYFVINGGGHKNEDVAVGRAIFYEHDRLDKEIQRELWKTLDLPEPTLQVDTGGKSIHSYWVLSDPLEIEQWCELQRDLLAIADGDRSIKNPARVMRLAGAWHISLDASGHPLYHQTHIISESGKTYSYESLRAIIPGEETAIAPEKPLSPLLDAHAQVTPPALSPFPRRPDEILLPVPAAVPLEICLAKESRQLLERGLGEGGRNSGGAKLARDLIGTHEYLKSIGQSLDGDPRQLLDNYARRCTPPLPEREVESIWKSAQKANPTPSCGSEGVETCLRSWYWKTSQKSKVKSQNGQSPIPNPSRVIGDSSFKRDVYNQEPLSLSATVTAVTLVLQSGLKDYEERAELDILQTRSLVSKPAFWEMVAAIRCQLDEVQPEDTLRLNHLIDWQTATLNFNQVLPRSLSQAFSHDAEILNIDPVSLWQYFLPTVLSLVGKRVNLDVESHRIPAIAWTCIVGESGTGKTRAEGVILAPLKQRQIQERKRWEAEWRDFQQTLRNTSKDAPEPESPTPERKYLFEVATLQALMKRLAEQRDNGSLWARDELAGLFKSLGQFSAKSRGENEGLECLLKMWDGGAAFVERMDEAKNSYVAEDTRLSIAGGIQPQAFRQAFKDPDDPQGLQARFLYAVPKVFPAKRVKGYCQLSDILPDFYHWLEALPTGTIKLSDEADGRYTHLVEQMGQQAESSYNPAIRAWLRKLPTQLLRIALALHLVECYSERDRPFWQLQRDTLERAVAVCRYYRSAFQVVQEKAADSDSISSILLKIWDMAATQPEGITPREIYRHIKAVGRRAADLGRQVGAYTLELLSKLVQMGKGKLEKQGRTLRFFAAIEPPAHSAEAEIDAQTHRRTDAGIKMTGVTDVQSQTEQAFELSSLSKVSPVTGTCQKSNSIYLDWLLQLLADLESQPTPHPRFTSNDQLVELFSEVEQKASGCMEALQQICPDYLERLVNGLSVVSEALSQSKREAEANPNLQSTSSNPQPSLAELQALLLACQTLSDLQTLKQKHTHQRLEEAYSALPIEQQLQVDSVTATAASHPVFKYTGQTIEQDGQQLVQGALVVVDSQAQVSPTAKFIPVWLMRAAELGWHKAISVSRSCLVLVEKNGQKMPKREKEKREKGN